jgi:hypothetical protein
LPANGSLRNSPMLADASLRDETRRVRQLFLHNWRGRRTWTLTRDLASPANSRWTVASLSCKS